MTTSETLPEPGPDTTPDAADTIPDAADTIPGAAETTELASPAPVKPTDIPGWFYWVDRGLFHSILTSQQDQPAGHLAELGTYLGKSTVVIGDHWRPDERFIALDLFGQVELLGMTDEERANARENDASYHSLSRQEFERNYLAFHDTLPEVVTGPSRDIVDHLPEHSVRFLHIDASHLYAGVREDVVSAARLMRPGGVVVFDDIRSEHTPGVWAAVWQAVFTEGLVPVAITTQKLYAVQSEPEGALAAVRALVTADQRIAAEELDIAGHTVLRLHSSREHTASERAKQRAARQRADEELLARGRAEGAARARHTDQAGQTGQVSDHAPQRTAEPTTLAGRVRRRVARDLAPPVLTRWVRARRN